MHHNTTKKERIKFNRGQAAALVIIIFTALMLLVTSGCAKQPPVENADPKQPPISSKPLQQKETVKLYFSDDEAMYLKPEIRQITVQGEMLAEVVIKELIAGPQQENLYQTIPAETKLISFKVADGVAYVNFSKDIQVKHPGGSTGEYMTVYSIVNTLVDLNTGIQKVQILVEGEKQETLVGHLSTFGPLDPDWSLTKTGPIKVGTVELNIDKMREIQQNVDNGHQPWYLDPLQVAMEMGTRYGFDPRKDRFKLEQVEHQSTGTSIAKVRAVHDGDEYIIQLMQPVKQGQGGIWVINAINGSK